MRIDTEISAQLYAEGVRNDAQLTVAYMKCMGLLNYY